MATHNSLKSSNITLLDSKNNPIIDAELISTNNDGNLIDNKNKYIKQWKNGTKAKLGDMFLHYDVIWTCLKDTEEEPINNVDTFMSNNWTCNMMPIKTDGENYIFIIETLEQFNDLQKTLPINLNQQLIVFSTKRGATKDIIIEITKDTQLNWFNGGVEFTGFKPKFIFNIRTPDFNISSSMYLQLTGTEFNIYTEEFKLNNIDSLKGIYVNTKDCLELSYVTFNYLATCKQFYLNAHKGNLFVTSSHFNFHEVTNDTKIEFIASAVDVTFSEFNFEEEVKLTDRKKFANLLNFNNDINLTKNTINFKKGYSDTTTHPMLLLGLPNESNEIELTEFKILGEINCSCIINSAGPLFLNNTDIPLNKILMYDEKHPGESEYEVVVNGISLNTLSKGITDKGNVKPTYDKDKGTLELNSKKVISVEERDLKVEETETSYAISKVLAYESHTFNVTKTTKQEEINEFWKKLPNDMNHYRVKFEFEAGTYIGFNFCDVRHIHPHLKNVGCVDFHGLKSEQSKYATEKSVKLVDCQLGWYASDIQVMGIEISGKSRIYAHTSRNPGSCFDGSVLHVDSELFSTTGDYFSFDNTHIEINKLCVLSYCSKIDFRRTMKIVYNNNQKLMISGGQVFDIAPKCALKIEDLKFAPAKDFIPHIIYHGIDTSIKKYISEDKGNVKAILDNDTGKTILNCEISGNKVIDKPETIVNIDIGKGDDKTGTIENGKSGKPFKTIQKGFDKLKGYNITSEGEVTFKIEKGTYDRIDDNPYIFEHTNSDRIIFEPLDGNYTILSFPCVFKNFKLDFKGTRINFKNTLKSTDIYKTCFSFENCQCNGILYDFNITSELEGPLSDIVGVQAKNTIFIIGQIIITGEHLNEMLSMVDSSITGDITKKAFVDVKLKGDKEKICRKGLVMYNSTIGHYCSSAQYSTRGLVRLVTFDTMTIGAVLTTKSVIHASEIKTNTSLMYADRIAYNKNMDQILLSKDMGGKVFNAYDPFRVYNKQDLVSVWNPGQGMLGLYQSLKDDNTASPHEPEAWVGYNVPLTKDTQIYIDPVNGDDAKGFIKPNGSNAKYPFKTFQVAWDRLKTYDLVSGIVYIKIKEGTCSFKKLLNLTREGLDKISITGAEDADPTKVIFSFSLDNPINILIEDEHIHCFTNLTIVSETSAEHTIIKLNSNATIGLNTDSKNPCLYLKGNPTSTTGITLGDDSRIASIKTETYLKHLGDPEYTKLIHFEGMKTAIAMDAGSNIDDELVSLEGIKCACGIDMREDTELCCNKINFSGKGVDSNIAIDGYLNILSNSNIILSNYKLGYNNINDNCKVIATQGFVFNNITKYVNGAILYKHLITTSASNLINKITTIQVDYNHGNDDQAYIGSSVRFKTVQELFRQLAYFKITDDEVDSYNRVLTIEIVGDYPLIGQGDSKKTMWYHVDSNLICIKATKLIKLDTHVTYIKGDFYFYGFGLELKKESGKWPCVLFMEGNIEFHGPFSIKSEVRIQGIGIYFNNKSNIVMLPSSKCEISNIDSPFVFSGNSQMNISSYIDISVTNVRELFFVHGDNRIMISKHDNDKLILNKCSHIVNASTAANYDIISHREVVTDNQLILEASEILDDSSRHWGTHHYINNALVWTPRRTYNKGWLVTDDNQLDIYISKKNDNKDNKLDDTEWWDHKSGGKGKEITSNGNVKPEADEDGIKLNTQYPMGGKYDKESIVLASEKSGDKYIIAKDVLPKHLRADCQMFEDDEEWFNHWKDDENIVEVHDVAIVITTGQKTDFLICKKQYKVGTIKKEDVKDYWTDYPQALGITKLNDHSSHEVTLVTGDIKEGKSTLSEKGETNLWFTPERVKEIAPTKKGEGASGEWSINITGKSNTTNAIENNGTIKQVWGMISDEKQGWLNIPTPSIKKLTCTDKQIKEGKGKITLTHALNLGIPDLMVIVKNPSGNISHPDIIHEADNNRITLDYSYCYNLIPEGTYTIVCKQI